MNDPTPQDPQALRQLAVQLERDGRYAEAAGAFDRLAALEPDDPVARYELGFCLLCCAQFERAVEHLRAAIALQPHHPLAHDNLGVALLSLGRHDEAIAAFREAARVAPDYFVAHYNLGTTLSGVRQTAEAIEALRRARELAPNQAGPAVNLAHALSNAGRVDEALAIYRDALKLHPQERDLIDGLLVNLHYPADIDPQEIFREHLRYDALHGEPLRRGGRIMPHYNDRNPDRRLRVGYVSPDFRQHAVASFIEPVLAAHDRTEFEIICYSNAPRADAVSARLRAFAYAWREIFNRADEQVAALVRQDRIDILVDLAGHTAGNRLGVFAHKPAPVQVTYLGYPDTTGLRTIDWRLTDASADPPGRTEMFHVEHLWRLPNTFLCYRPPDDSPAVAMPPPSLGTGRVTFGSFNNVAKVNDFTMRLWARVLEAVPGSRLLIKSGTLADRQTRDEVADRLAAAGVERGRVEVLAHQTSLADHLGLYAQIDVALDTFPYHGTTTTCEALWMGLPLVTLIGQTHAARVGLSLLSAIGLGELCAQDESQFVEIASTLATDGERLGQIRAGLRQRMRASPLMDRATFAREIEQAYRAMWRRWCAT